MPWMMVSEHKSIHVPEKTVTYNETVYEDVKTKVVLSVFVKIFTIGQIDVENTETIRKVIEKKHTMSAHDEIVVNTHWVEVTEEKKQKPKVFQILSSGPSDGVLTRGSLTPLPTGVSLESAQLTFAGGVTLELPARPLSGEDVRALLKDKSAMSWFDESAFDTGLFYGVEYDLPVELVRFRKVPSGPYRATRLAELLDQLCGVMGEVGSIHRMIERGVLTNPGHSYFPFEEDLSRKLQTARAIGAELNALRQIEELTLRGHVSAITAVRSAIATNTSSD